VAEGGDNHLGSPVGWARLWSAIGLNKVDAVYFSHMHRPERVVSGKIAMIRSPDLSRNDGRYSRIAEF
jgi:hypothetical protein